MALCRSAPSQLLSPAVRTSSFAMALPASSSVTAPPAHLFFPMGLPGSSISATAPPLVAAPLFARAPPLATAPQPATNLIRRRRSPVWLAIWRTWAGFANSQLRRAAFRCTYSYICTHPRYCRLEPLLRQTQIFRPICTDCLRHLRISAG